MVTYAATTHGLTVHVQPVFLDGKSDVFSRRFAFAYFVRIVNHTGAPVQLLRRRWRVEERSGRTQEVEGEGVVGEQPVIEPGEKHAYASMVTLSDLEGWMEGAYTIEDDDGVRFEITVPRFHLVAHGN